MDASRYYTGARNPNDRLGDTKVQTPDGRALPLRLDLRNHSPTGFEWGYGGSGPAQLALALCAHALGDDRRALRVYMDFKFRVIARLAEDEWALSKDDIVGVVVSIEEKEAAHGPA